MHEYKFIVTVDAETKEQADRVMQERIGFDEDYGFDYSIDWEEIEPEPPTIGPCRFSFPDVAAQAEYEEIELTPEQEQEVWEEVKGFLKHCTDVEAGNIEIQMTIERMFGKEGDENA